MNAMTATEANSQPGVYVVVLNWNGWRETLACLESLLASDYPNLRIVVCDNGSTDGSEAHIRAWADAHLHHSSAGGNYHVLDRATAERAPGEQQTPLVLIQNGENLGFAGGNNVGICHALAQPDCDYVWLLNNDTRVKPDTLSQMVARMAGEPAAGVCGATLVDAEPPHRIQALAGARYNRWLGTIAPIGAGGTRRDMPTRQAVEAQLDYVIGASMLVSRAWLDTVGLLSEDYFLYFEEIDWISRGAGRFRQVYAPEAVVYHQHAATIGGPAGSTRMDGLALRNRLRFTARHHRAALPTVWLGMLGVALRRMRRRQWRRVPAVLAVMLGLWRRSA